MDDSPTETSTNILYRCNQCFSVFVTELNINNLEKEFPEIFKSYEENKQEIIFFIKVEEDLLDDTKRSKLLYEIDKKSKKIFCKMCQNEFGYYERVHLNRKGLKKPVRGVALMDRIDLEEITHTEKNSNELNVVSKFVFENLALIKNFKLINEIVTSYSKDFYRMEFIECTEKMEKIKIASEKISKQIN